MLSLIDVKCPHCHAQGRIVTPPPGSIIVGPCPECSEMVAVFGGRVLPLDKGLMQHGTTEEKKRHLMEVLGVFIEERIERLLNQPPAEPAEDKQPEAAHEEPAAPPGGLELAGFDMKPNISDQEFRAFLSGEMDLLDNPKAFKAIFG
ncbi:MAG: hypothetical protein GC168_20805 [Candidatus Hydrogenedens sp.]|nr:hypothetical protein [Candidatus Hydrogenedens sp.]